MFSTEELNSVLCSQPERWTHPADPPEIHWFSACGRTKQRLPPFLGRWISEGHDGPRERLQHTERRCIFLVWRHLNQIQWPLSKCYRTDIVHTQVWYTGAVDSASQGQRLCRLQVCTVMWWKSMLFLCMVWVR